MKISLILAIIFLVAILGQSSYSQDESLYKSGELPEDSTILDSTQSDSLYKSKYEIELKIDEYIGTNKIGQFFHQYRYDLDYNLDSIPEEKIDEYIADMRARRSVKSVIYGVRKPIPMHEWPRILEFANSIYTGFKPINTLLIFGY